MQIHTIREGWQRLGTIDATAAAADGALGVAERDFITNKDLDNVVYKKVPLGINSLEARFLLTTDGANVTIDVWAGRNQQENKIEMARVCTLDVECGQQDADDSTHHYADEIIATNKDWLKTISVVQSGNDTDLQARLTFDFAGYEVILFHGHTTFAEDCIIEISGY